MSRGPPLIRHAVRPTPAQRATALAAPRRRLRDRPLWLCRRLSVGKIDRLKHVRQNLGGKRCPDGGDAVDAQLLMAIELAEDEPVGLHRCEREQGAHEDPSPEAQECAHGFRVPA